MIHGQTLPNLVILVILVIFTLCTDVLLSFVYILLSPFIYNLLIPLIT